MRIKESDKADRYFNYTGKCFFHRGEADRDCPYCRMVKKEKVRELSIKDTGY